MLTRTLLLGAVSLLSVAHAQKPYVDTVQILHTAEVYFPLGRWNILLESQQLLEEAAALGQRADSQGVRFRIAAHTDAIGRSESNRHLSMRRAQAAAAALEALGIARSSMVLLAYGEEMPVAPNDTEAGRQRNRRAEITAYRAVPMTPFLARAVDQKTRAPVPATVYLSLSGWRDTLAADARGYFRHRLPKDSSIHLQVFAPGYFFHSASLIVGVDTLVEILMAPAVSGEKMALRNLLFYGNQAVLLPESEDELSNILRFMQMNPQVRIEIAGHINNPLLKPEQLSTWEWELSVNRAKLVYNYLLRNGIAPERMRYKGYGNAEMLYPKPTSEEEQAQNRRVEIRIQ